MNPGHKLSQWLPVLGYFGNAAIWVARLFLVAVQKNHGCHLVSNGNANGVEEPYWGVEDKNKESTSNENVPMPVVISQEQTSSDCGEALNRIQDCHLGGRFGNQFCKRCDDHWKYTKNNQDQPDKHQQERHPENAEQQVFDKQF